MDFKVRKGLKHKMQSKLKQEKFINLQMDLELNHCISLKIKKKKIHETKRVLQIKTM